eukprot:TRINITY_DN52514_c0_g1_i2.p1 TRINITY_DN52514_c0_g1~~TRINITY_DN52514_c0_g1_i2.p1  ORF type:complete len:258 (+),score=33.14 TRINITY_DN52514_c0_g1_i2:3-776(+)
MSLLSDSSRPKRARSAVRYLSSPGVLEGDVLLSAIDCTKLAELETVVAGLPGHLAVAVVDVSNATAVQKWAAEVEASAGGPPHVIINNAGVSFEAGSSGSDSVPFWELPAEHFDETIDVNIKGVANVMRAFLPGMVARAMGIIVNLSSGLGRSSNPVLAAYSASKFAVEGLTKSVAMALPEGMAAIPLAPGIVLSDMQDGEYPRAETWAKDAMPFILNFTAADNGRSLSVPGYYPDKYKASWIIKDGQPLPSLGHEF